MGSVYLSSLRWVSVSIVWKIMSQSFEIKAAKDWLKAAWETLVDCLLEFFHKYTKLAMLSILYCFIVKGKLISAKSLPPVRIEPATLRA